MKKIVFLALMLAGCTTYHQEISSYYKIDTTAKTVAIDSAIMTDIHQDFKQALKDAGFRVYNKDEVGHATRYELLDDINKDDAVRCGLWEDGYTYEIVFRDNLKKAEVFSMEGKGCQENILRDFTALVNNRYDEKTQTVEDPEGDNTMKAPNLRSDGRTWWGN